MVVIAPDTVIGRRRPVWGRDEHGTRVVVSPGEIEGALPGRVVSEPATDDDAGSGPGRWVLAVDPLLWPVLAGEELAEPGDGGRSWTVVSASHRPSAFDPAVAYVRVEASLNSG